MIHEIEARVMLSHVPQPDEWFGLRYNMNLYRGCQHQCIYCDSRSECYGIENFKDVLVKTNAVDLLNRELPSKREKGTIGTGSMSDPYGPVEREYNLTGRALKAIAHFAFPVHILTKSDMVLKDLDTLVDVNRVHAVVSFSLTTADDDLARNLEPGAPSPSRRLAAMAALAAKGIPTGVLLMPVLPFISDPPEMITDLVQQAADHGARYVLPSFGMTLRDRQRDYYYDRLDRLFPGLRAQYQRSFGPRYHAAARNADRLYELCHEQCALHGLATQVSRYQPPRQLALF